jgi:regulatory protein
MRTRKELVLMLSRKRVPAEVSGPVLDRLEQVGLVNDEAYARAFVASRQRSRPRGRRGLAAELAAKGVSREVIDRVLAQVQEAENPVLAARRAVLPKLRQLAGKPPAEIRRKAEQFLLRRGFSYQEAREALQAVEPEEAE